MSQKPLYDDSVSAAAFLPLEGYSAEATATPFTLTPAQMLSAQETFLASSGNAGAVAVTTPTAALMYTYLQSLLAAQGIATVNQINGSSFYLRIINNNTASGIITLTGGTGCTINGTATIAISTFRDYLITITGPSSYSLQNVGSGTN